MMGETFSCSVLSCLSTLTTNKSPFSDRKTLLMRFRVQTWDCLWEKGYLLCLTVMETITEDGASSAEVAMAYLLTNYDVIWITRKLGADELNSTVSETIAPLVSLGLMCSSSHNSLLSQDSDWMVYEGHCYGFGAKAWYCHLLMQWLKAETGRFTDLSGG